MFGKYVASAGFVRIIINHGHSEAAAGACAASRSHPSIQRRMPLWTACRWLDICPPDICPLFRDMGYRYKVTVWGYWG